MASHYPASQWRSWIEDCQGSDLTVAQFCESIGVSANSYYRWRQRLQNEPIDSNPATVEFVPIAVSAEQIEIELPGGSIARIANDASSLRPLVALLLELGGQS